MGSSDSSSPNQHQKQHQRQEETVMNFGSSLLVPSVQELVKEQIAEIPHRYIRSFDEDYCPAIVSDPSSTTSLPTVPIIDIQLLLSGDQSIADSELERLHFACKEWGFFQVVNHGVSSSLIEKIKLEVQDFFKLPFEEKKKLWQQPDDQEGFGQLFVVSEEQKLDWSDMFFITTLPSSIKNSNLFAKLPPSLRETLETYSLELKELTIKILERMAKALQMDSEEMRGLFNNGLQTMRLNYYPPCSQAEKVLGFTPHSDGDALTIVLQINETEGLQIRKDGKWVPVKPISNAFVVNIGDMIEVISNGVYRSIEHRAVVNSKKERLSIATFHTTNVDAELGPAHSLIDPPHKPALFKRVSVEKYFKDFFARKLDKKSNLDFLRIENGQDNNSK